jgi:MFS family permease
MWGGKGGISSWLLGLGGALALGSLVLAHVAWLLLVAALAVGWISARAIPLSQTLLMANTAPGHAPRASSHYEIASRTGFVAGPLMGGLALSSIGGFGAIALTSMLLAAAALLWWNLDRSAAFEPVTAAPAKVREGWRAIYKDHFLVTALAVRAGSNLLWPAFTIAIPLLIRTPWHAHAIGYGAVRTLWGLSTVAGTLVIVPYLLRRLKIAYFGSWIATGAAFVAISLSQHLVTALAWVAIGALFSPIVHVALDSHIGTAVADIHRPAVYAIQRLVMAVVNLLGLGLMSGALRLTSAQAALGSAGALMAVAAVVGLAFFARTSQEAGTRRERAS